MGLFGDFMDPNGDGKVSDFEKLFLAATLGGVIDAAQKERKEEERLAELVDEINDIPGVHVELETDDLGGLSVEKKREQLGDRLTEPQDALFEHECEEPDDMSSEAYDIWEERRDELEEQIEELEELIDELDG